MQVVDWGEVPYKEAVEKQLDLVEQVAKGQSPNTLVFCTHPPVVTTGRATEEGDVFNWKGELIESSRGGRATYHGPNQIVAYPIFQLKEHDLHKYLRGLEKAIGDTLKEFGLESEVHDTGVWVNDKKIASIGIAVKKWVTYHGIALNIYSDPEAFQGINPCGFKPHMMTSLEEVIGKRMDVEQIKEILAQAVQSTVSL